MRCRPEYQPPLEGQTRVYVGLAGRDDLPRPLPAGTRLAVLVVGIARPDPDEDIGDDEVLVIVVVGVALRHDLEIRYGCESIPLIL